MRAHRFGMLAMLTLVAACGPHQQARWGTRGDSPCPDDRGCELAVGSDDAFHPPDEQWRPPPENLGPADPKPRPASCDDVALAMTSLELGNYADPAARDPAARKYAARCRQLRLDAEERGCVYAARDQRAMAWCAPRLFPSIEVRVVSPARCADVIAKIRDRVVAANPSATGWQAKLTVLADSCRDDRWTEEYAACAEQVPLVYNPGGYCAYQAPSPLIAKLNRRFAGLR